MRNLYQFCSLVATTALLVKGSAIVQAGFLNVDSFEGVNGITTFSGSLDGVPVTGTSESYLGGFSYSFPNFAPSHADTTTNGTSLQYSYASVYSPAAAMADRVGYMSPQGAPARLTITFASPVTDLRFHVAELDGVAYRFDLTGGLTGVSLVSGNGGNGDGLQVVGSTVSDVNPATGGGFFNTSFLGIPPDSPPPLIGDRPAYGTVSLNGTYTTLTINVTTSIGDGGSFTLSSVPEPTAMTAIGLGGSVVLGRRRRAV